MSWTSICRNGGSSPVASTIISWNWAPALGALGLEIDPDRFQPVPPDIFMKRFHLDSQEVVQVSCQCPGVERDPAGFP